jgi:predicted O-methyltransferase YrrM
MALAVGQDGRVVTCDMAAGWSETRRRFWRAARVDDRIEQRIGRAQIVMAELLLEGQRGAFDLIFLDADRENYAGYLSLITQLLAPGGLLVADDVLGSGEFAEKGEDYGETQSLRAFNGSLHGDEDFDLVMLPLGRGMTLAIKK